MAQRNNHKDSIKNQESNSSSGGIEQQLAELKKLTEKNTKTLEQLEKRVGSIRGWVITQRIWFFVKIAIIIIPIILGVVYLPPLFDEYRQQVQNFFIQANPSGFTEDQQEFLQQHNQE